MIDMCILIRERFPSPKRNFQAGFVQQAYSRRKGGGTIVIARQRLNCMRRLGGNEGEEPMTARDIRSSRKW